MKFKNLLRCSYFFLAIIIHSQVFTQKINLVNTGTKTSIRGLCVVDDKTIWASGSNGMVARSVDGGKSFDWFKIPNFEKREFRDIEAFDSNTAIIVAIAEPAYILKTNDGGKNWKTVFSDSTKGMFLDAIFFSDPNNGVVIGDPINNKTYLAITTDGGNSWIKDSNTVLLNDGEAFFASSGSNVVQQWNRKRKKFDCHFVSGGKHSNYYFNGTKYELPIVQGLESTGANSIAINKKQAIVVGGDFAKDSLVNANCVLVDLKKMKFSLPQTYPNGYRSCVAYLSKKELITCGINGVDISNDKGFNWTSISKEGFHVVAKAKKGNAVFLAGGKGKIAKLEME